jgi:hypothetical protein
MEAMEAMEDRTDMNGMQKIICSRLENVVKKIREGEYGIDDDIDVDLIDTDLYDLFVTLPVEMKKWKLFEGATVKHLRGQVSLLIVDRPNDKHTSFCYQNDLGEPITPDPNTLSADELMAMAKYKKERE